MSQKDKRPPVGVGAGNAAFGKAASRVFITEGVANAAVGAEVDKSPAVPAMGKSNLLHAARAVRELAPDAELIILADNDLKIPKEAHETAVAVGGRVVVPELDGRKCDLWDVLPKHHHRDRELDLLPGTGFGPPPRRLSRPSPLAFTRPLWNSSYTCRGFP